MMTEEQRAALREMIARGKMGEVTDLELERYPAKEVEIRVETSLGSTAVYVYENCDSSTERPLVINFHGGGLLRGETAGTNCFAGKWRICWERLWWILTTIWLRSIRIPLLWKNPGKWFDGVGNRGKGWDLILGRLY